MLALCREHRLEHRTKHIALRYFLARELQQRGQLRLAYVASQANNADIFTKALPPGDHQRFCFPTCGGGGGGGGSGGSGGGSGGFGGGGGGSGGGGGGGGGSSRSGGGGSGGGQGGAIQRGVYGGGHRQQQQRRSETPMPQQLCEWFAQRGASGGSVRCPYVIRTGDRAGQTCGKLHTQHRCFSRLNDAWRTEFGNEAERPRWAKLLKSGVDIFALDYDAILAAMYALSVSAEGDCYLCVPPNRGIEAAALGASESALHGTTSAEAMHTFTLDSDASRCFFRDGTTLTPLPAPVPVRLADPSGGLVLARSSTVLPCLAVPSGSHSGLHLPSFSTNLVSSAAFQDAMVTTTTPGGQCVSICTCTRTGRHVATFTCRPGSSLYTLTAEPPEVAASAHIRLQPPARVASCRTRLSCGITALVTPPYHAFVACTPTSFKSKVVDVLIPWIRVVRLQLRERFRKDLPVLRLHFDRGGLFSSNLLQDLCCGEGILQTFTLPASPQQDRISERHIGLVMEVARTSMIHAAAPHFLWPFVVRYVAHQLNLWPRVSFPETSPTVRWAGKVGDASVFRVRGSRAFVQDTSAAKFSSRAIPCVFLGFPPDAHSGAARGDASEGAASGGAEPARAEPEGAEPKAWGTEPEGAEPGGAESEGAEFGGAKPWGTTSAGGPAGASPRLSPQREPLSPQQLREWFAQCTRLRGGAAGAGGSAAGGTGAVGTGATSLGGAGAAGHGGARTRGTGAAGAGGVGGARAGDPVAGDPVAGGARAGGAGAGDTDAGGTRAGGTGAGGTGPGGAEAGGAGAGGPGARGTGDGDPGASGAGVGGARAGGTNAGGTVQRQPFLTRRSHSYSQTLYCQLLLLTLSRQTLLQSVVSLRLVLPLLFALFALVVVFLVRLLLLFPDLCPSSVSLRVPLPSALVSSLPGILDPESDLARAASPTVPRLLATDFIDPSFESTAASALVAELVDFAAACRLDYATSLVAESKSDSPPSVRAECALGTNVLEDRKEELKCLAAAIPHLVAMLLAPEGDPNAQDILTPRSYAEAITGPYSSQWQTAMDAEMASWKSTGTYVDAVPPSGANIGVDFFKTFSPTPKMTTLWVLLHVAAQRDYEQHSLDFSTAFLQGSLHEEIWLRRPLGFTGSFPAGSQWSLRRPVYGIGQAPHEWHDIMRTTLVALGFAPSTADPSLFLRTDTSLPPFYILVYVDNLVFATADTEALALVKLELQKRHTCSDVGELRSYLGLQITRDRARRTITLTQSHMVEQVLQRFGFTYSSPQSTPLPTGHSLSTPPSDESVEPSGPYPMLVGCLMYLMTCTRPDLAYPLSILARCVASERHRPEHREAAKRVLRYLCSTSGMGFVLGGRGPVVLTGHADTSWVDDLATQRTSEGYTFSLGSGCVSWWSTRSSSVLSSSCEAEIYAGAMSAQELRLFKYPLTDLGERPRSSPILNVDNKAMIALYQEHRPEHRTKHIALRYFLA
ncbi:unnamed protein product [Closterium sp. NIES-54]